MTNEKPRVSVGLPVYNGEEFLAEAIDSILAQTFQDFELIICDNASTDSTAEICRSHAAIDKRIRYYRNEQNIGAAPNFNRVFELSKGEYFKWMAHDDVCRSRCLEKCVDALDKNSELVMAYPKAIRIDEKGKTYPGRGFRLDGDSPKPHQRFGNAISPAHGCFAIFAVIRSCILAKTPLIASYLGSDRVLLAELFLHGPALEIPEELAYHRDHQARSIRAFPSEQLRLAWFDPKAASRWVFPSWRKLGEYYRAVGRSPLGWSNRMRCHVQLVRWVTRYWKALLRDLDFLTERPLIAKSSNSGRAVTPKDEFSNKS